MIIELKQPSCLKAQPNIDYILLTAGALIHGEHNDASTTLYVVLLHS